MWKQIQNDNILLSEAILACIYNTKPSTQNSQREKSLRDIQYHLSYLADALKTENPSLFKNYVAWIKNIFNELGFERDIINTILACMNKTLQEHLTECDCSILDSYFEAAQQSLKQEIIQPPLFTNLHLPLGGLAKNYLDALFKGERKNASLMILEAVEKGVSIQEIYVHVFQRTQYEIGRLWQSNKISVAQEHYCTAATQLIMSQLYPYLFSTEKNGYQVVTTSVSGDLHEIGARMVADFFEIEGWDTYYLGANTPTESIIKFLTEEEPHLLGISATLTSHVSMVETLIKEIRKTNVGKRIKILVGGRPFNAEPTLWKDVKADGYGENANEAISVAKNLIFG